MAINLSQPVNWNSPLNRGLKMWHLGIAGRGEAGRSRDLLGRYDGAVANTPTRIARPSGMPSLAINGVASPYATIANSANYKSSTMAVSCWIMTRTTAPAYQAVYTIYTSDADAFELFMYADVSYRLAFGAYPWQCFHTVVADTWYHVYCEAAGTSRKMWVNGLPAGITPSGTSSAYGGASNTADFVLLSRPGGSFAIDGAIDDIRVTNGVIASDDFVMQLYLESMMGYRQTLNRTKPGFITSVAAPAGLAANPLYGGGAAASPLWGYVA